ncbi:MAG: EAL domain-containing protein [Gallionellaceae bacterium]|jgi:diguanylate cyclase (GGDEF)-like protein/PAS domain S-box-containing protein
MMRFGISARLLLASALVAILPLLALQQGLIRHFTSLMQQETTDYLRVIARHKMAQIDNLIEAQQQNTHLLAQMSATKTAVLEMARLYPKGISHPEYREARRRYLDTISTIGDFETFYDIFLISPTGEVMMTEKEEADLGSNLFTGMLRNSALSKAVSDAQNTLSTQLSEYVWYAPSNAPAAFLAAPVMEGNRLLGMLAIQISSNSVNRLTLDYSGLGDTGEIELVKRSGDDAVLVAPLRHSKEGVLQKQFLRSDRVLALHRALDGETGAAIIRQDYRNKEILAAWGYLPRAGWGVVVKIDAVEVFKPIELMRQWSWGLLLALLVLSSVIGLLIGRSIIRPVNELTRIAGKMAGGSLDKRVDVMGNDEIGDLATAFNTMANNLEGTQNTLIAERRGLEEAVRQRTAEIESINVHLVQEIAEHKTARAELLLAETVYQSSAQGIVVADQNNHILSVNPAFSFITGFSAEEVIGLKPGFNSAGYHDADFYKEMWRAIQEDGLWAGEIWDRRKNGESFSQWLTISVVRDEAGEISRFIGVFTDNTEQKQAQEKISFHANYDELTKLPNRRLFQDRLQLEIKKSNRADAQLALLFIDLDNFKEVNDSLGHEQGDQLLRETAQRLRDCVRETDTVARLGGDEFTIILPGVKTSGEVENIAQKIIQSLTFPFTLGEHFGYVSASIGITIYPQDGDSSMTLLKNADQAMYEAKHLGKNRFSYFTSAMQQASVQRLQLTNEMREALQNGQFEMYFQPIHDAASGKVTKAEALIRWHHPERGFVSPAAFIPLAEEVGLISEIGEFAFTSSVRRLQEWATQLSVPMNISVNLSPRQISGKTDFEAWIETLRKAGISTESITLEITEGSLLDESLEVQRNLRRLRDAGFGIAIDDFGTGYSSLSYLKKLDVDFLKVDQSFVRDLVTDTNDRAMVEAIIVMAHKLGIKVIAEGCETAEVLEVLMQAGCDLVQGYYYAKPMPAHDFVRYVKNNTI